MSYPTLLQSADRPEDFVPQGWAVEKRLEGAFTLQGTSGVVFVLRMQDPRNVLKSYRGADTFDSNPRMLVGVVREQAHAYRLVFQDTRLIPRYDSPGYEDIFQDAKLEALNLTVHLVWFGSSVSTGRYTFRYQPGCFRLIGIDRGFLSRGAPGSSHKSINLLTGQVQSQVEADEEGRAHAPRKSRLAVRKTWCLGALEGLDDDAELN